MDVEAVMELPVLVALPWIGESHNGDGKAETKKDSDASKEMVEV
jgi:hypothetical protein